jgi:hypothetical protein
MLKISLMLLSQIQINIESSTVIVEDFLKTFLIYLKGLYEKIF